MHRYITVVIPEYRLRVCLLIRENLTIAEEVILILLLQGKNVSEIATHRRRSPKTISAQKLQLYKKLGVKNDLMFWREVVFRYKAIVSYLPKKEILETKHKLL